MFWKAPSTFVASSADVSTNDSLFCSANAFASSVWTSRKCFRSHLLPTSMITMFLSALSLCMGERIGGEKWNDCWNWNEIKRENKEKSIFLFVPKFAEPSLNVLECGRLRDVVHKQRTNSTTVVAVKMKSRKRKKENDWWNKRSKEYDTRWW